MEWLGALDDAAENVGTWGRRLASIGYGSTGWSTTDSVVRTMREVRQAMTVVGDGLLAIEGEFGQAAVRDAVVLSGKELAAAGWEISQTFASWTGVRLDDGAGPTCASFSSSQSTFNDTLAWRVPIVPAVRQPGGRGLVLLSVATVVLAQARVVAAGAAALELDQGGAWDSGLLANAGRSLKHTANALFAAWTRV